MQASENAGSLISTSSCNELDVAGEVLPDSVKEGGIGLRVMEGLTLGGDNTDRLGGDEHGHRALVGIDLFSEDFT